MKTSDFIFDKQEEVINYYGLHVTRNKHISCVSCGKEKKMRISWYNGNIRGICVCNSFSLLDLLQEHTGMDFKALAADIDKVFGNNDREPIKPKNTSKRDKAISLFRSSVPLRGSDAEVYLNNRGIYDMPTGGVKYGLVYDYTINQRIPAMIALASTEFTEPRQLHVTYIQDGKKADIETPRKMHSLSPQSNTDLITNEPIAIKLFQATALLGIGEGIETALSAKQLYKVPVWSVLNATYMKRFRAPSGVFKLYVFADNDSNLSGLAAAMECARGNLLCSNDVDSVVVRWPEKLNDFNDVLCDGDKVVEWAGRK